MKYNPETKPTLQAMGKKNLSIFIFVLFSIVLSGQSPIVLTYTSGDIESDIGFQSLPGFSSCPGSLTADIPAGNEITSVDVSYNMTSANGSFGPYQVSWLYSPTITAGEPGIAIASGSGSTRIYQRTGLTFANRASGSVEFQLHAGRKYYGTGCNTTYEKVNNNTWILTVHYAPIPSCREPGSLTANLSGTTAELTWTAGNTESLWNVEVGAPGFSPGSGNSTESSTGITNNSWTVTDLKPLTDYEYYVQSDCGTGDLSIWAGPFAFTTECGAYSIPFLEDFDENHFTNNPLGNCWNQESVSGTDNWVTTYLNSDYCAYLIQGNSRWIFQKIRLEAGKNYTFSLSAYQRGANPSNATLKVAFGDSPDAAAMDAIIISERGVGNGDFELSTGTFSVPASSTYYIGIYGSVFTTDISNLLFLDDISISESIPGTPPADLSVENITSNSADLYWVCGAAQYDLEWGFSTFTPGSGTNINIANNNYHLSSLNVGTVYEYYVRAIWDGDVQSEWSGPYKFSTEGSQLSVEVSGSNGTDGQYSSLKKAFVAINSNTQTDEEISIAVIADSYEGVTPSILYPRDWASLTIYPSASSRVIYGNVSGAPLIDINGADNVSINGLLNGDTKGLTIVNISTSPDESTSTIRFINNAEYNVVKYCNVLGSATVPPDEDGGTIFFSTSLYPGHGNDYDTISNCIIGPAAPDFPPSKGIYSHGTENEWSDYSNTNLHILNNEIFDFFLNTGCAGIDLINGTWKPVIEDNIIYQTRTRELDHWSNKMYGIHVINSFNGSLDINRNTIGYSSKNKTGNLIISGAGSFSAIEFALNNFAEYTINQNVISNISIDNLSGSFLGIINTSGSTNSTTLSISDNTIRNISKTGGSLSFTGIDAKYASTLNVTNNSISNFDGYGNGKMIGISFTGSKDAKINNNDIYDFNNNYADFTESIWGISMYTSLGIDYPIEIDSNRIYDFSTNSSLPHDLGGIYKTCGWSYRGNFYIQSDSIANFVDYGGGASVYGMLLGYGNTYVTNNIISNIYSTNSSASGIVRGIKIINTGNHFIERNKIFKLSANGTNSMLYGIDVAGGLNTYILNNLISDLQVPISNSEIPLAGINISSGTTANIMYNTIYLDASSSGALFGSAGILANSTTTLDLRNNNIINISIPSGSGITSALRRVNSSLDSYSVNSDNNNLYAGTPGLNNLIFYDGTNADQAIDSFKERVTPRDGASFSENPPFINTSVKPYDFHIDETISTKLESGAVKVTSPSAIIVDYDENTRTDFPDVGAYEFDGITPMPSHPENAGTSIINSHQIDVSFDLNNNNDDVLIVWNTTGIFYSPFGTAPDSGSPFAGGTLLSKGLSGPVHHTGLTPSTTYYYKLFSYSGSDYSPGITASATTIMMKPTEFGTQAISNSQIDLTYQKNAAGNDVFIVVNSSFSFGTPVAGVPVSVGESIPGGATLIYSGPASSFSHTGLSDYTLYYYKIWTVDEFNYYSPTGLTTFDMTSCTGTPVPFTEGFENNNIDWNLINSCWSHEKIAEDNYWIANNGRTSDNRGPRTGSWNAILRSDANSSMYRALELEGGKSYTVELYARQSESDTELGKLEVNYGIAPNSASMSGTIIPSTGLTDGDYQLLTGQFTPSTTGTYYIGINGITISGFFSTYYIAIDDIEVNEEIITSYSEESIPGKVKVYPNPSDGKFTILCQESYEMNILDITGNIVHTERVNEGINEINIETYNPGVYMIRLQSKNEVQTLRIIINK